MYWQIEYSKQFKKSLDKLDKPIIKRILKFIEKLKTYDNPLILGKLLVGEKIGGFSRFKVGDYRIIYKSFGDKLVLYLVALEHRNNVYKHEYNL